MDQHLTSNQENALQWEFENQYREYTAGKKRHPTKTVDEMFHEFRQHVTTTRSLAQVERDYAAIKNLELSLPSSQISLTPQQTEALAESFKLDHVDWIRNVMKRDPAHHAKTINEMYHGYVKKCLDGKTLTEVETAYNTAMENAASSEIQLEGKEYTPRDQAHYVINK